MTEPCCEYLSVRCIWLHVLIIHVRVSEYIHNLDLPECQGTPQNRCNIWSLSDCNGTPTHNHLVRKRTIDHLATLAKWLIELCCEYLPVRCIWLYVKNLRKIFTPIRCKYAVLWCSGYYYYITSFNKAWIQVLCVLKSCLWRVENLRRWDLWQWSQLEIIIHAFRRSTTP